MCVALKRVEIIDAHACEPVLAVVGAFISPKTCYPGNTNRPGVFEVIWLFLLINFEQNMVALL